MSTSQTPSTNPLESRATQAERCCGGPAAAGTTACCARDAEVKSRGGSGCGCSPDPAARSLKTTACCG